MQCACAIWPSVAYPAVHFSTLSHKLHNFRKKLLNVKCVFRFYLQILSEAFFTLRRSKRDMIKNVYWSLCTVPVIVVRFWWNFTLSSKFRKILKYKISWKSVQWEPSSFIRIDGRTGKQTDMTKLIADFRNFGNAPKKWFLSLCNRVRFLELRNGFGTYTLEYLHLR
jgi:hypothetical protein